MSRLRRWRDAATRKGLRLRYVRTDALTFACLEAGDEDGPLALCLHGFPDHAFTWQYLLPALAGAGWHAVAPWMRGYFPTHIPADAHYQPGALAADAVALHGALGGRGDAVLIGHDWGAVATYGAAGAEPGRWAKVVTLAVPPRPAVLPRAVGDLSQWRRSSYIGFFQLPWLPERAVMRGNGARLDGAWARWWAAYRDDLDFRSRLLDTFTTPGVVAAALGYYRALFKPWRRSRRYRAFERGVLRAPPQPTLYLHGTADRVIGPRYAALTQEVLAPGSDVVLVPDTGHFLHLQRPAEVNGAILSFLDEGVGTASVA